MKQFTKHHDIVAQIKAWFAKKQFAHVTMSEKVNFVGNPYDDYFVLTELVLSSPLNNFPHIKYGLPTMERLVLLFATKTVRRNLSAAISPHISAVIWF